MIRKREKSDTEINYIPCIHRRQENKKEIQYQPKPLSEKNSAIEMFYSSLSHFGICDEGLRDCFALRLARLILSILKEGKNNVATNGSLEPFFYAECVDRADIEGLSVQVRDQELLLIYIKQTVLLLRNAGIISVRAGRAVAGKNHEGDSSLLLDLFDSFWNRCPWGSLFPSNPKAAMELKKYRSILRDIVIAAESRTEIEKISNDFFELTGFTVKNDLFMISFLDFYVFTWLKHFGLVRYFGSGHDSPVSIEVTRSGKSFLRHFPEG